MTQTQNNVEAVKHKAVSMKLAFIFYLKISEHFSFIPTKTEKGCLKQGGTLREHIPQTTSSSFSCDCLLWAKNISLIFF